MQKNTYETPLNSRYASKEMQYIFSPDFKFKTWRKLWIALAEAEHELGLPVTQEQIDELKAHADDINYEVAIEEEKKRRHDVMSHVYAYGVQCPNAKGIIHLGATSCYVGDNTDVITMTEGLKLIEKKLVNLLDKPRTSRPSDSPITSRLSRPPSASVPPCGSRTSSSTTTKWNTASRP